VSRICSGLDADVDAWRARPLDEQPFPYVFLDATYCKVRINTRVVSQAVVIATGVSADGRREVLGCAVGDSETEAFWTEFLRGLRDRGLSGGQLVISDAHRGLVAAVAAVLQGAAWQRCRVHFMRNALAKVGKAHAEWSPSPSALSCPANRHRRPRARRHRRRHPVRPGPSPPTCCARPRQT